jgi:hypothetical protein
MDYNCKCSSKYYNREVALHEIDFVAVFSAQALGNWMSRPAGLALEIQKFH